MGHYHASCPALRKFDKRNPEAAGAAVAKDPRILTVFSAVYRIEAGAWARSMVPWLLEWLPQECDGGLPNRQILYSAWDVQAFLEEALNAGEDGVVALLDYFTFFNSFGHNFVIDMMQATGTDDGLAQAVGHLNVNLKRCV